MMHLVALPRDVAQSLGLKRYCTNTFCVNGHFGERRTDSGVCCICANARTRKWRGIDSAPRLNSKPLPDIDYLRECFDIVDSVLVWGHRPRWHFKSQRAYETFVGKQVGKPAGYRHKNNGYLEVRLDGEIYKGHRLLYKLYTGKEPEGIIDHANGSREDDRLENLRPATAQENARNASARSNSASKYKGVASGKNGYNWCSIVTKDDKNLVRYFHTEEDAALDYHKRAAMLFGDFYKACPNTLELIGKLQHGN